MLFARFDWFLNLGMAASGGKKWHAKPISSENKITIWELRLNLCCIYCNNYSPRCRWIAVDIYRAEGLFTSTLVNNCYKIEASEQFFGFVTCVRQGERWVPDGSSTHNHPYTGYSEIFFGQAPYQRSFYGSVVLLGNCAQLELLYSSRCGVSNVVGTVCGL